MMWLQESESGGNILKHLEPISDLDVESLRDDRRWLKRDIRFGESHKGAHSEYYLDDPSDRSGHKVAYSVYGPAPTLTTVTSF